MASRLFKPASDENVRVSEEERIKAWEKELESFKSRKDVFQRRSDGAFNVKGNVNDWGAKEKDGEHLASKYGSIMRKFSCGGTLKSLNGAPQLICGDFSFRGELKSLKGFPKEVWGSVEFINHPYPGNKRNAKRWKAADIKKVCDIRGKIRVENYYGL